MFRDRMIDVARRKERLVARIEGHRLLVARAYRSWREPARVIDRVWLVVLFFRLHPAALAVTTAAALVLGRRRLLTWTGRGLFVWRAWRAFAGWLRRARA